jgi:hypothetical protein
MAGVLKHTVFESPIIPMGYIYEREVKCMYIYTYMHININVRTACGGIKRNRIRVADYTSKTRHTTTTSA